MTNPFGKYYYFYFDNHYIYGKLKRTNGNWFIISDARFYTLMKIEINLKKENTGKAVNDIYVSATNVNFYFSEDEIKEEE